MLASRLLKRLRGSDLSRTNAVLMSLLWVLVLPGALIMDLFVWIWNLSPVKKLKNCCAVIYDKLNQRLVNLLRLR